MKVSALHNMKKTIILIIIVSMFLVTGVALAGTLTLPSGLTEIEEEAFMNDASLDNVVVPEGVVYIGRRAFAGTGLTQLTLPSTLEIIGADAFRGCDTMSVTAPEGSWAYEWALERGYLKTEPNTPTQLILPATLQAGEDLTISIIGASNTVRHGVYLIKNSDQSKIYRALSQSSGQLTWEAYQLEPGDYKITVYTVTDTFTSLTPVDFNLSVIGTKPVADAIEFPKSIFAGDNIDLTFSDYESCFASIELIDKNGTEVDSYEMGPMYDGMFIWTDYTELLQGGSVKVSYSPKVNGLWCQPKTATVDIIPEKPLGTPDIVFPSQILAGQDLLILCDWVENATHYTYELYSSGNSLFSLTLSLEDGFDSGVYYIPGYLLSAGDYELHVNTYNRYGSDYYLRQSYEFYPFTVTGEWMDAPIVTPSHDTVRINNSAVFTIDTKEADQVMVTWQYGGYGEQTTTISTVNDQTEWTISPAERYANKSLTIHFSVHKNDRWSAKKTLIYNVEDIEQLAPPVIHTNTDYLPGKNSTFSFNAVEHASKYTVELYRDETRIARKTNTTDQYLDVNGYDLLPGNYRFVVTAYGEGFRNSTSEKTFTVAGTMPNAPVLTSDQEKVYEGQSVSITIVSDNAEGIMVSFNYFNEDGSFYDGYTNNYSMSITGIDEKKLNISSYPGKTVQISACTTVNDMWSAWSEPLSWTILSREQLASPILTINDTYNAGEDVIIQFSAVENAESYNVVVRRVYGNDYVYNTTVMSTDDLSVTIPGYMLSLASYRVNVTASASEYKSSTATSKIFKVSGEWPEAPEVTLKQDIIRINTKATFVIDTDGADLARVYFKATVPEYDYYYSDTNNVATISSHTEWSYTPDESNRNGTLTLQVAVHKNNRWSTWKTLAYTIEDLEQLAEPIIHVDNEYPAGRNATFSFDPVEHATKYGCTLYRGDQQVDKRTFMDPASLYFDVNGYLLIPSEYRIVVQTYGDGYRSNTSEATFIVTGTLPSAPVLTSDQEKVYEGESVSITIASSNAEGILVSFDYYNEDGNLIDSYTNNYSMSTTNANVKKFNIWSYPGKTVQITACTTANDTWSAWSEPLTWTILAREQLASPAITVNETFSAGEDVTIQLSEVEHAESYYVEINRVYGNDRIYSSTIQSSDALSVNVPGYLMTLASYRVTVTASASEYKSSAPATKTFKVSGAWLEAPEVTLKEDVVRINSKATFLIDTEGADLARISYSATMQDGNVYNSNTRNITVASSQTEWSYTPYEYTRNGILTLKVAVHKNNQWSAWKTLTFAIEDLEQLAQPNIKISDSYQAGETIVLRFDAVENAEYYEWNLSDTFTNNSIYSGRKSINTTYSIYGYNIEPGTYRYSVTAYANGYRSNLSEKVFTIGGTKEPMGAVTVDKSAVKIGETFTFTIDTTGLSALRYRINQNNSYSINVINNTTKFVASNNNEGKQSYQFTSLRNGLWTQWSEPIQINVTKDPEPEPPVVSVNNTIRQGQNLSISYTEVSGANEYWIYLFDENGNTIQSIWRSSASTVTIEGYTLTPGSYSVRVSAYINYQWISSPNKTIIVLPSTLSTAPEILSSPSESIAGSFVSFSISTSNAEKLIVRYCQDGYTNDISSETVTVTETETQWQQRRSTVGQTWFYQFAVYRNGAWSEWTAWQAVQIVAEQSAN